MTTSSQVVEAPANDQRPLAGDQKSATQQVREIPLDQLQISPGEARKTMGEGALKELADSIALKGVQEPLLVRSSGRQRYEIVAGQRRFRGSQLAGKKTCPCIVREISDAEAAEIRIISNLQREDLAPLEEAEAFAGLLRMPGATVETVAAKLAKSGSYVGRRLKLLDAVEPVREALKAGAIEVAHALELARLSTEQQQRLLQRLNVGYNMPPDGEDQDDVESDDPETGVCRFCGCTEDDACEGGCSWVDEKETVCSNPGCIAQWKLEAANAGKWEKTAVSVQELKRTIAQWSLKDLNQAPFPLDAAGLAEQPCTICPKRSMNSALLFSDLAGTDTCTDRACFDRKATAWIQIELKNAATEEHKLLKLSRNWSGDKSALVSYNVNVFKTPRECPNGEEAIWIDGDLRGERVTICRDAKCKTHRNGGSSSSGSRGSSNAKPTESEKAERRKVLDKVKSEKAYRVALFAAIVGASPKDAGAEELNLRVCASLMGEMDSLYSAKFAEAMSWHKDTFGWGGDKKLAEKLKPMSGPERLRLALLSTHAGELGVHEYTFGSKPDGLEKLAALLNLDPKKIRLQSAAGQVEAKAAPAAAKTSAKKAAAKTTPAKPEPKKPVLSAEARKRIAAAQKKRWATAKKPGRK